MKGQSELSQMQKLDQMCGRSTLDSGASPLVPLPLLFFCFVFLSPASQ